MFKPSLEEFKKLAKSGNLIPVYKEILADLDTPVSAYMKIGDGDYSFLLKVLKVEKNGHDIVFSVAILRWLLVVRGVTSP